MKSSAIWLIALIAFGSWAVAAAEGDLAAREMSVHEIIAALGVNDLSANEVRAIDSYVRLDVVDLSAFESSDEYQALETALGNTDDGWAMMQTAIIGNDLIEQELKRRSVEIGRVVAATMDDKGVVTIYIR
ncbi:hypothetical protein [Chelativorans salis]|uniref:Uncharacterized protein n=1 Tax=Chelativorans salis TaxID=2978478 RepID=A0ABT2LLV4_9HYPH|nr:hypothetical protein [Chelativorans sp. EGI FJ00035]MCT7375555.1 hypothetical protein [Chelativorans sp. EGI FJ00035]